MSKYIPFDAFDEIVNTIMNEDNNNYISVDRVIRELQKANSVNIPPIREVDKKRKVLENILRDPNLDDHLNKSEIEAYSIEQNCKITRASLIRWENSMQKLGYQTRAIYGDRTYDDMDIRAIIKFLWSMKQDQKL